MSSSDAIDGNSQPEWRVARATVIGTSHVRDSQECQDSHTVAATSSGLMIIAVADGAGSAPLGKLGSRLAADSAMEALLNTFSALSLKSVLSYQEQLVRDAMGHARERLIAESLHREVEVRSLATTLLLAVLGADGALTAQLGDGAIVAEDCDGSIFSLTIPQNGEYANTTNFLSDDDALAKMEVNYHPGEVVRAAAFTDGLQRCALNPDGASPFKPFFVPLFRFVATVQNLEEENGDLIDFLRSPRVTDRTDDDLTLVLVSRLEQSDARS